MIPRKKEKLVEIGKEAEPFIVEPLEEPIPNKESTPAPVEPEREPEKVPA